MISPAYATTMAQYNAWQNALLLPVLEAMSADDLTQDRGAFFGSILGTANHILWGDQAWMSRFDDRIPFPGGDLANTGAMHPTVGLWSAGRQQMDRTISQWAAGLKDHDLSGDLSWFSASVDQNVSRPMAACVVHFFNHQTHHRGQIHAMLTAMGQPGAVSDLVFLPEGF